jgi:hypothetical protein
MGAVEHGVGWSAEVSHAPLTDDPKNARARALDQLIGMTLANSKSAI